MNGVAMATVTDEQDTHSIYWRNTQENTANQLYIFKNSHGARESFWI